MKKFIIAALALALSINSFAGDKDGLRLGLIGGFSTTQNVQGLVSSFDNTAISNFHGGVTLKTGSIAGFVFQPSLVYTTKSSVVSETESMKVGYLEVPVQVQWGINLFGIRPYVFAEPYVGYALSSSIESAEQGFETIKNSWQGIERLEYGVGLGAGVTLWNTLQVSLRYSWGLGDIASFQNDMEAVDKDAVQQEIINVFTGGESSAKMFNGLSVSLGIFF